MSEIKKTATDQLNVTVIPYNEWDEYLNPMVTESSRIIEHKRQQGEEFAVSIVGPRVIRGRKDESVEEHDRIPMAGLKIEFDQKLSAKLRMVEHAREFITAAQMVDYNDPHLPGILASVIEGRNIIEFNGLFNYEYGKLEQKYGQEKAKAEFLRLLKDDNYQIQDVDDQSALNNESYRKKAWKILLGIYRNPATQQILWGQINTIISRIGSFL